MIIEPPIEFLQDFIRFPTVALRQYANYAGTAANIFYFNWENIQSCYEEANPFNEHTLQFQQDYFCQDNFWRYLHVDLSKSGDAAGIVACHIPTFVSIPYTGQDREKRDLFPFIRIDFLGRILPKEQGGLIDPAAIREVIFEFVRRGFKARLVTYDGYQSWESILRLRDKRIYADNLSIDRTQHKVIIDHNVKYGVRRESTNKQYTAPHEVFRTILSDYRMKLPRYPWIETELKEQDDLEGEIVKIPGGRDDVLQALVGAIFNAVSNTKEFVFYEGHEEIDNYSQFIISSIEGEFNKMIDGEKQKSDAEKKREKTKKEKSETEPQPFSVDDDYFNDLINL